jgi:hypothetical protein
MHAEAAVRFQVRYTEDAETSIARLDPQRRIRISDRIGALVDSAPGLRPIVDIHNTRRPMTITVNGVTVAYDVDPELRALTVLWVELAS